MDSRGGCQLAAFPPARRPVGRRPANSGKHQVPGLADLVQSVPVRRANRATQESPGDSFFGPGDDPPEPPAALRAPAAVLAVVSPGRRGRWPLADRAMAGL